jgi:predicted lipoprotein with Yx(FWY)xxD motif
MNQLFRKPMLGAFTGLVCAIAACGGSSYSPPAPALMFVSDARLGNHLADGAGRSIYYFSNDVPASGTNPAVSNCSGVCAVTWPSFHVGSDLLQGVNAQDLAEITRADGTHQTTYRGWPLYYFVGDSHPGDVNGEGFDDIWFVLRDQAYTLALLNKPAGANAPGLYLSDGTGRTVYQSAADTVGTATSDPVSACVANCLGIWPVFEVDTAVVPSTLAAADFTVFTRPDGQKQSAYKGHPLYFFAHDVTAGDTIGQGVNGRATLDPRNIP